eukprot:Nk52_evm11s215 gene=Nk52_evmTU11s215
MRPISFSEGADQYRDHRGSSISLSHVSRQMELNEMFQLFLDSLVDETVEMMQPFASESDLARKPTGIDIGSMEIGEVLQKTLSVIGGSKKALVSRNTVCMTESAHLAIVCRSAIVYLQKILSEAALDKLGKYVSSQTSRWLSSLTGLYSFGGTVYHNNEIAGFIYACKDALCRKFPNYRTEKYEAFGGKLPIVYLLERNVPESTRIYISEALCLPVKCVKILRSAWDDKPIVEPNEFQEECLRDIKQGMVPLAALLVAGTRQLGYIPDIEEFLKVSSGLGKDKVWIHVQGDAIGLLIPERTAPANLGKIADCDSVTMSPSAWYGLVGAPCVTFLRARPSEGLVDDLENATGIKPFVLWVFIKHTGQGRLVAIIKNAVSLVEILSSCLRKLPYIESIADIVQNPHLCLFRFIPEGIDGVYDLEISRSIGSSDRIEKRKWVCECLNYLNRKLVFKVNNPTQPLILDLVEIESVVFLQFNPLVSGNGVYGHVDNVEYLCRVLSLECEVFRHAKDNLSQLDGIVEQFKDLQILKPTRPLSVAVRFFPTYLQHSQLSPEIASDVEALNLELASVLGTKSDFISGGKDVENRTCVYIDLMESQLDQSSFVHLLQGMCKTANSLEESKKLLVHMEELIRKGIEDAESDLKQESDEKLLEDGIIRQVPVIGNVLNWLSPIDETQKRPVMGRTFELSSGRLEKSTESVYGQDRGLSKSRSVEHRKRSSVQKFAKQIATSPSVDTLSKSGNSSVNDPALNEHSSLTTLDEIPGTKSNNKESLKIPSAARHRSSSLYMSDESGRGEADG